MGQDNGKGQPGARSLEVHEHSYITGPHINKGRSTFAHSHAGGDVPHVHDDGISRTGPAARTIDKDEWAAATGMRGGGRKQFTAKPTGVQLPLVPADAPQIKVVIVGDGGASIAKGATGGGALTLARMQLAMGARVASVTHKARGSR